LQAPAILYRTERSSRRPILRLSSVPCSKGRKEGKKGRRLFRSSRKSFTRGWGGKGKRKKAWRRTGRQFQHSPPAFPATAKEMPFEGSCWPARIGKREKKRNSRCRPAASRGREDSFPVLCRWRREEGEKGGKGVVLTFSILICEKGRGRFSLQAPWAASRRKGREKKKKRKETSRWSSFKIAPRRFPNRRYSECLIMLPKPLELGGRRGKGKGDRPPRTGRQRRSLLVRFPRRR